MKISRALLDQTLKEFEDNNRVSCVVNPKYRVLPHQAITRLGIRVEDAELATVFAGQLAIRVTVAMGAEYADQLVNSYELRPDSEIEGAVWLSFWRITWED